MAYDPRKAFKPGEPPGSNPLLSNTRPGAGLATAGDDPRAWEQGVYRRSGRLRKAGRTLTVWDPATNRVESFDVVKNQAVVTLTIAGDLIVGLLPSGGRRQPLHGKRSQAVSVGSEVKGKVFETVPVSGAAGITDLVTAPNGKVYGIAGRGTLFCFDPVRGK